MKYSSVAHILPSAQVQMGNISIKQPLPTQRVAQISPFLLLHHFGPFQTQPGEDPLDIGPHPHRGFEPVTFLYSGGIRHKDSRGNEGILSGGDIQWMTAGRGIIHSERASREFLENGGTEVPGHQSGPTTGTVRTPFPGPNQSRRGNVPGRPGAGAHLHPAADPSDRTRPGGRDGSGNPRGV